MDMNLLLYLPEIIWHDREGILSIDVQQQLKNRIMNVTPLEKLGPYKIVTASLQKEIRIWEFYYELQPNGDNDGVYSLTVNFLANLVEHKSTTNVVRFSPNGKLVASGDVEGNLIIWKLTGIQEKAVLSRLENVVDEDFPPNRENWVKVFRPPIRHFGDVTCVCWSPDSKSIASVTNDDCIYLHSAFTGKPIWSLRSFRHYPNGIAWDPRGKYIVTLSTDRRLDIIDAERGTRIRNCFSVELPTFDISLSSKVVQEKYRIFHDDQLISFMRGVEFSPCGSLVFAPAGHLELGDNNVYGSYIFRRADFDKCRPFALLPAHKPTIMIKCSPIFYELRDNIEENYTGLPYRLIFAVICKESVVFYDTQFSLPFAYASNIHYAHITNAAWTPDGRILAISSLEGFNSFLTFKDGKLGKPCVEQKFTRLLQSRVLGLVLPPISVMSTDESDIDYPDSPRLAYVKKKRGILRKNYGSLVTSTPGMTETPTFTLKRRAAVATPKMSPQQNVKRTKGDEDASKQLTDKSSEETSATPVIQKKISDFF